MSVGSDWNNIKTIVVVWILSSFTLHPAFPQSYFLGGSLFSNSTKRKEKKKEEEKQKLSHFIGNLQMATG